MKAVIAGMNNAKSSDPDDALEPYTRNGAGERLWQMVNDVTGCSKEDYLTRFTLINILETKEWSAKDAAMRAGLLRFSLNNRRVFVLGKETWEALRLPPVKWLGRERDFTLLPHPSGKNLMFNEEKMRRKVGTVLAHAGGWTMASVK